MKILCVGNMRVMRVASCFESLQVTFLQAIIPLLLLLLYCYLLITASFGNPEPSLAPRLRTVFILNTQACKKSLEN